ncbi:protein sel-1 homolog 3 isoform X2 [Mastacembelus armatus]|nr:protein sel-1 homolog 3-like isoform X2 [Mastacembelus armatus]
MNVLHSINVGYIFTAAIIMGQCMLQAVSTQSSVSLPDNFIGFDSAPDKVVDGSVVHVRYQCSRPCQLAVEVVVSILRKTDLVVFRRKWIGSGLRVYKVHRVLLRLPPSILYQHNIFNRNILEAQNVTVRAWLDHLKNGNEPDTYHSSILRISKVLWVTPLSERPTKPPTESPSWFARMMWQMARNRIHQCPHESDTIDMLEFPLASTGEHFGVVRRFQPFIDRVLERARRHAVTQPSITLSVWIYLLKWCHQKLCGIIHHVDRKNVYDSVLMQLTDTGDIIIQARVTTGKDEAFRVRAALPLWKWIRLDCYIQDSKVLLNTTWNDETRKYVYQFRASIHYDDTDGYFGIGGSKYIPGIHGYFGPIKYYRFGTKEIENQLHPKSTLLELDRVHQECQEITAFTKAFWKEVVESHLPSPFSKGVCMSHSINTWGQIEERICTQTWSWETQLKHSTLFHFLQAKTEEIRTGFLSMKALRRDLFEKAVGTMFLEAQINIISKSTELLQMSSCFGNHEASLFLAAIHFSNLGHSVNQEQGHIYSLIGASGDNRFALMHAGFKHIEGIDGFPKDLDMAYSYYSNAGTQSSIDIASIHEYRQYILEHIYLSNPEDLYSLTHEASDIFEYLKLQAESGHIESQTHLASMLYWGQNGISKDIASAVKWFKRSAMQMKDPSVMYDYAHLLMKGHGVKRNYTQGFLLLKKAAAMTAAFHCFLNASRLGNVAASVEAAWYLSTGSLEGVSQDVERAVKMLKKVCEQNGHLGFMIREALQAYLQGSWQQALVKYILAAETGLGLAQSNAAHLCEELNLSHDCQRRYHNYSTLGYDPHPTALLKMGDYYYYSSSMQEDSLSLVGQAISMYSRAALAGSPQGMYNLVVLAQQGHALPLSMHSLFNVSHHDEMDVVVEKMLKRCVAAEDGNAVTPCSLALLAVQMGKALRRMTQNGAQLLLAYASLLSVCVIIIIVPLQSCFEQNVPSHRAVALRARASSVSQDGVNLNREQNGIVGGNYRGILWLTILNGMQWLQQTSDLAVTLSAVCLCAFWTTVLYHLL